MNTKKEQSISNIMNSFNEMADRVLTQLSLVEKILTESSKSVRLELAAKIKENEDKIDTYEVSISDKFINTIVLYQPVASEIRKLVAIYRMALNLERIGDLVMNITHAMDTLCDSAEFRAMTGLILNMLISSKTMVEKSLLSFTNNDNDYAIWTIKNDSVVDEMNQKLLINSISGARISSKTKVMLLSYTELKNIISNIERIADHATNIAEASIYSQKGTDIRHSGMNEDNKNNL
jgi:phosphate transport system protein